MRGADLRKLKRFSHLVESMRAAHNQDFTGCSCVLVEGRWTMSEACKRKRTHCRTATHTASRTVLTSLRLNPDHLDDPTLDHAVADLNGVVLDLPRITVDQFQERIHEAMRVSMTGQ